MNSAAMTPRVSYQFIHPVSKLPIHPAVCVCPPKRALQRAKTSQALMWR